MASTEQDQERMLDGEGRPRTRRALGLEHPIESDNGDDWDDQSLSADVLADEEEAEATEDKEDVDEQALLALTEDEEIARVEAEAQKPLDEILEELGDLTVSSDPVRMYLQEIGRHHLLTADEEKGKAERVQNGARAQEALASGDLSPEQKAQMEALATDGRRAQQELAQSNLRLVVSWAKRYAGRGGMSLLDLIQEGNLGLLRAVEKFDPALPFRFSTYATYWIRHSISRAIAGQARTIRVPVHMHEQISRMRHARRDLAQELGREPTTEELALEMDLLSPEDRRAIEEARAVDRRMDPALEWRWRQAEERVRHIVDFALEPMSLETPVGTEDSSYLGDFIEDEKVPGPGDAASREMLKQQMRDILNELTPREREVLEMRYGLRDGKAYTLEEVGQAFDVTRERVRQIEARALRKLRHPLRSRKLRDFLAS
jgi:RNA polymerase primary sigma factor